jgi:hypothetical protein
MRGPPTKQTTAALKIWSAALALTKAEIASPKAPTKVTIAAVIGKNIVRPSNWTSNNTHTAAIEKHFAKIADNVAGMKSERFDPENHIRVTSKRRSA